MKILEVKFMKHPEIIEKMSLEQKAKFVSGFDYWHLEEDKDLGLPEAVKFPA